MAEDNLVNRTVVLSFLKKLGCEANAVPNGREVLPALDRTDYDLVLMDMHMPEMDGLAATRQVRATGRWPDLPIIALTASAMPVDRERCVAVGMNDYLSKPVFPGTLEAMLAKWASAPDDEERLSA